ncbi:MAG: tyrosine-type recombinase/integrase [Nanoarchaeota archaeon]
MIERDILLNEMKLRGFSRQTMKAYVYWNHAILSWIRKSPKEVAQKDIESYLLFLHKKGLEPSSRHNAVAALRFYYSEVLRRKFRWVYPKKKRHLPIVISKEHVLAMIESTKNIKHRLLLELLYGSGVRVGEAVKMKSSDINASDGTGIIREGKGGNDRMIIVSKRFLEDFHAFNNERTDTSLYLFPSNHGNPHISKRTAEMVVKQAAKRAGVKGRIFPHALRSSFATHLIDNGTPLPHIQRLLGHSHIKTTLSYIRVSKRNLKGVESPLD